MTMTVKEILQEPVSGWMKQEGTSRDIVISSRVRLARNVRDIPFPHRATGEQLAVVLDMAKSAAEELNRRSTIPYITLPMNTLNNLERMVLVEKHLISPQFAENPEHGLLILREDGAVSVMVNEEDHFRVQCLAPGLTVSDAWALANQVDDVLEEAIDFAFDDRIGYLTCCPTNVGTGLRVSIMMHLPALVATKQIHNLLPAISKLGLAVRGFYGEGSDAIGNIFQISNQVTLGPTENDVLEGLQAVTRQIIEQEHAVRSAIQQESGEYLADRVCRAYGTLQYARVMTSDEAIRLLSDLRLGIDLGIISECSPELYDELIVLTRPHFLQQCAGRDLSPGQRDIVRAEMIRERIGACKD